MAPVKIIRRVKSRKQVGFLLSRVSPLTGTQRKKLVSELHTGKVKVRKSR
jgi:hypothetical protein